MDHAAPPSSQTNLAPQTDVNEQEHCGHISVKLPQFWRNYPRLWFENLEAQFALARITSDVTKYRHALTQLTAEDMDAVADVIAGAPAESRYVKLKEALISRFSSSQMARIRQLVEREEIGDRTPSQFLRRILDLAGNSVPNDFARTIWISRLPVGTQTVLTALADKPLPELAELADKLHEVTAGTKVAAVASDHSTEALRAEVNQLRKQLHELSTRSNRDRRRDKLRERNKSRNRSATPASSSSTPGLCWYHRRHGERAKHCTTPCTFSSGNGA